MKPTTPSKLLSKYAAAKTCALERLTQEYSETNHLAFHILSDVTKDLERLHTPLEEKWKEELNFIIDNY